MQQMLHRGKVACSRIFAPSHLYTASISDVRIPQHTVASTLLCSATQHAAHSISAPSNPSKLWLEKPMSISRLPTRSISTPSMLNLIQMMHSSIACSLIRTKTTSDTLSNQHLLLKTRQLSLTLPSLFRMMTLPMVTNISSRR